MKSKTNVRGLTLVELLIVVAIVGVLLAIVLRGCASDWTYSRKVTGMVTANGGRIVSTGQAVTQKYALQLEQVKADSTVRQTAGDGKTLAVDCLSTRCSLLQPGECVQLACKLDYRFAEPNVISCKVERVVECADIGVKPRATPAPSAQPTQVVPLPVPTEAATDW